MLEFHFQNSDLDMVKVEASRLNEMLSTSNVELIASQLESLKRKSKEQDKFINELQLKCEVRPLDSYFQSFCYSDPCEMVFMISLLY